MQPDRLVSIVTPCYNCERYLEYTVESVLAQSYSNWELLLIDDSSKDRTPEIIKQYVAKDSRIRSYKTDKPSGSPVLPRNIGIENAKSDLILFLDSDDIILPDKLKDQVPLFDDDKTAIVFSNYKKMDDSGKIISREIVCPKEVNYRQHLKGCSILFSNAMFDLGKTGKIFFERIGAEDYVYGLTVLKKGFVAKNTGLCNSVIRKGITSVSSNKLKSAKWNWNIYYRHEKLGLFRSLYYFSFYAFKGLIKYLK